MKEAKRRSITIKGFRKLVDVYAPEDENEEYTSNHLRTIFRGERSYKGKKRKFCPINEEANWVHYSTTDPEIVVSYTWKMDLRKDVPCFLAELCNLLLHKKIIASSEQFEQKTLWLDIFFNDQNSTDIVKDLEAAELIYQQAALHALFLMYEPLSRGWVLFEIGVRVWKCAKDYSLTLEEILGILSGKDSKERIVGYKPITPSEIASKFPIIVAAAAKTDIQKDLIRLVQNLLFVTAAFPVAVILAVADSNMTAPIRLARWKLRPNPTSPRFRNAL